MNFYINKLLFEQIFPIISKFSTMRTSFVFLNAILAVTGSLFSPLKPVENVCETSQDIFSASRVHIDVVLTNFCDLDIAIQHKYIAKANSLNQILVSYGSYMRETFSWDVRMNVRSIGSCKAPIEKSKVMSYALSPPIKDEVTLLFNIVFKPDFKGPMSHLAYSQWASKVKNTIRDVLKQNKAKSMTTFVLHQYDKHHDPSTERVYHSLSSLPILPNEHYHLEVIEDVDHDYGNMGDTSLLLVLKNAFACNPAYLGGDPYQYTDEKGNYKCICRCRVGEKFERIANSEIRTCVPIKLPPKNKCGQLAKCYSFSASEIKGESKTDCRLKVFEKARLPCPWDNYVAWHNDPEISKFTPRITARLTGVNLPIDSTQECSWGELRNPDTTFAQLLDQKFTITRSGIYRMTITAHDFDSLESCTTEIRITDNVVPSTGGSCPTHQPAVIRYYKDITAIKHIEAFKKAFTTFSKKAVYGKCENGDVLSKLKFKVQCLDETTCYSSGSASAVDLKKRNADHEYLSKIKDDIVTDPPGLPIDKCIFGRADLIETTNVYSCENPTAKKDLRGASCQANTCYKLAGRALYKAGIEINPVTQKATKKLMETLVPGFNGEKREIHERIVDGVVTKVVRDLSMYFDIDLDGTNFGIKHFDSDRTDSNLQKIINCRFKVPEASIGDSWQKWKWNDKNQVELNQETNSVQIQCWTKLGHVGGKNFRLVIHPTAKLDICDKFTKASFYQSVTHQVPTSAPSEYCNVPGSDFAELAFHFNNWVGRGRDSHQESQYFFWKIQCLAAYDHGDDVVEDFTGTPANVVPEEGPQKELVKGEPEPAYQLIKRFGINLKRTPTTKKKTRVRFECRVTYRDRTVTLVKDRKAFVDVDCQHTVTFRDCDKPEFPVVEDRENENTAKDCEDLEQCHAQCGDEKLLPYQYCGPHLLTFKETEGVMNSQVSLLENVEGKTCCSDTKCTEYYGTSFNCARIGPDDDLQRCEPNAPKIVALLQSARSNPAIMSAAFISALVVMAVAVRHLKVEDGTQFYDDQYVPL